MTKPIIFLTLVFSWALTAQPSDYWQQEVRYQMDIDFDVQSHRFEGHQKLTYYNHSSDTLKEVFYHLYFNAFQPGSMMDVRSRHLPDPDRRVKDRIQKLKPDEQGFHEVKRLTQNGRELALKIDQTVLRAPLREPLAPGDSALLEMQFTAQVPVQIRRSGRNNAEGIDYTMTQWYPKIAAYDRDGWHPYPYVAREFYAPFGRFEVVINIDSKQRLAGTGILQNEADYWQPGSEEAHYTEMKYRPGPDQKRTWHFVAENVHDFAWAADEDYIRLRTQDKGQPELNFFFLKKHQKTWRQLPPATAQFFRLMEKDFGDYAYPQFSVIQGGDGGMEYPMCTMLKGTGKLEGLIGVMAHEAAHNWYYGMLATNENRYPWMDEGFTTFAEDEVLNQMKEEPSVNPHLGSYAGYLQQVEKGWLEPMATPADFYDRNRAYAAASYWRGALFLSQLRYITGEKAFRKAMKQYYRQWRFKHPGPEDFLRIVEKTSGLQLDWYYQFWVLTTKTIDYGVVEVTAEGRGDAVIHLKNAGNMPMPVEVVVRMRSGHTYQYFIPLLMMHGTRDNPNDLAVPEPWPWTHPDYALKLNLPYDEIEKVSIDPLMQTADVNRENNTWERGDD